MKKLIITILAMFIAINAAFADYKPYITIIAEEDDCDLTFITNGGFWYMTEPCVVYTDKYGVATDLRYGSSVESGTAASYNMNFQNKDARFYTYEKKGLKKGTHITIFQDKSLNGMVEARLIMSKNFSIIFCNNYELYGGTTSFSTFIGQCYDKIIGISFPVYRYPDFWMKGVFSGMVNLEKIHVIFENWDSEMTKKWVSNVAPKGTFICPENLETIFGDSYIPEGWTVRKTRKHHVVVNESCKEFMSSATEYAYSEDEVFIGVKRDAYSSGYGMTMSINGSSSKTEITDRDGYGAYKEYHYYSFIMPDEDVEINVEFTPIVYNITCSDYVSADLSQATVHDIVNISVADRTSEGYKLDKVLVNGRAFGKSYIEMKDYLEDIQIQAVYSKMDYSIKVDDYIYTTQTKAQVGDKVYLTVKPNKTGYKFVSANYNGIDLSITNNRTEFTMPAENVVVETVFEPIQYNVIAGEFIEVDKTSASIEDEVNFSAVDRTAEGYKFEKILINNVAYQKNKEYVNKGAFSMKNYLKDVEIKAEYSKISYSITTDEYSSANVRTATVGEEIELTFKGKQGYYPAIADCNGKELIITDNKASFVMPTENVKIKTIILPIQYKFIAGDYLTVDKTTATIEDVVKIHVQERLSEGLRSKQVYINDIEAKDRYQFNMKDYLTDVTIKVEFYKENKNILCDNRYVSIDKTSGTIDDVVNFTIKDRTSEGYKFERVTVEGIEVSGNSFAMKDFWGKEIDGIIYYNYSSMRIDAEYSLINYNIVAGKNVTVDKSTATKNDWVNITYQNRIDEGYMFDYFLVNGEKIQSTSFVMWNYLHDVEVEVVYAPIAYNIVADDFITIAKKTATVEDIINFTVKDRTTEGYQLDKVFVNNVEFSGNSFAMKDYMQNIEIKATYTPIQYNIVADGFVTVDKSTAFVTDNVTFSVKDRTAEGYKLDKILVNNAEFSGNSFAMKDYLKNVEIKAFYTPIQYNVVAGDFVTVEKTTATVDDKVSFSVKDRTSEGYKLDKVLVNDVDVSRTSFDMKNYLKDVEVKAIYSKIDYPITTDNSVTIDKTTANIGDEITITVKEKDGYTPRLIINGEEVKLSGNQYVYTVTSDKIDFKVVYEENKPTPISEIPSVDNIAVSVFPNPTIKGEKFNINIEGKADFNCAEILIYDSMGRLAKRLQNVSNHNEIDLLSGIYNGVFVNKGVKKTFRIVVH